MHMWSCASPAERNRAHTARRAADRAEREMLGGEEELWGPFGEVASTGGPEAQATTPTPTRRESMPPPPAPSPAPPSPVSPLQPATATADREELGSFLPQRGLLHRGGAVRQLRLRSPSPGILQEEGAPSATAVEGQVAPAAVADATIAAEVDEIAAAAAVLKEMAASLLAEEAPAAGGATTVEGGRRCTWREFGAEGLGMPHGSRREQTVAEASARVVVLRKGGCPVTIEEDDPDTNAAVREADEDYEGREDGEEESRSGSDGDDDDDYDEPQPPPGPPPTRCRPVQGICQPPTPVSYTHLDVYKRQILIRMRLCGRQTRTMRAERTERRKAGAVLMVMTTTTTMSPNLPQDPHRRVVDRYKGSASLQHKPCISRRVCHPREGWSGLL
ncbi:hypothetical protein CBR_g23320 [Chara braunii]|uniref:Uncharacterized protein n=1 Tax=Chara braunii TaxID=69332 RepID=A0A388L3V3_CHABU|nr:hypothetical protein CBR_g23320 [Chara braunii]|eukprot:GBG76989.1 hypothetical protein CBR_g23320 [Chara braunii]